MATSPTFRSPALPALWRDASSLRLIALVVVAAVALGAKPLKAETSVNLSGGAAWSPTEALTMTLDAYSITLNDRILLTGFLGGPAIETILAGQGIQAEAGQYFTKIGRAHV
mgnify:CR=1 FL=1